jgi:hypothetical protein
VQVPVRLALAIALFGTTGLAIGADAPSASITVKADGSCVLQSRNLPCSELPGALVHEAHISKDASLTVSPEECGERAVNRARVVAGLLKDAGFTQVAVVGFLTEPGKKCTP